MYSRHSSNNKKKTLYIKWITGIGLGLLTICAVLWLSIHNWDVERSIEIFSTSAGQKPSDEVMEREEPKMAELPEAIETTEEPNSGAPQDKMPESEEPVDATVYLDTGKLPEEPTIIDGVLLVNKQHPLPQNYKPGENPEARAAYETMRADALKAGIELVAFSTYRGFARQKELYEGYVAKDGQEAADRYSARPGFSEHQTGLAFDIGEKGQEQHWASTSFGGTKAGKWLLEHAHRYGFILRYPEGSENITGYMHESWHFRYVGKALAEEIHEKQLTLEEYLLVH